MKISNIWGSLEDEKTRASIIATLAAIGAGFLCSALNQWRGQDFPWPNDLFYGLRTGTTVLIAFALETSKFSKKWPSYLAGYMICADPAQHSDTLQWTLLSSAPGGFLGTLFVHVARIVAGA
jgi:hypothetical protein